MKALANSTYCDTVIWKKRYKYGRCNFDLLDSSFNEMVAAFLSTDDDHYKPHTQQ